MVQVVAPREAGGGHVAVDHVTVDSEPPAQQDAQQQTHVVQLLRQRQPQSKNREACVSSLIARLTMTRGLFQTMITMTNEQYDVCERAQIELQI